MSEQIITPKLELSDLSAQNRTENITTY